MLIGKLNDIEAVKVAVNLEKEGVRFYREAAALARNREVKAIFSQLGEGEKEHLESFRSWQEELKNRGEGGAYWDAPEIDAYIRNLVKTGVFSEDQRIVADTIRNDREALLLGIAAEKDSVLFYREAQGKCHSSRGRELFTRLEREEKAHLNLLVDRLELLRKGKNEKTVR